MKKQFISSVKLSVKVAESTSKLSVGEDFPAQELTPVSSWKRIKDSGTYAGFILRGKGANRYLVNFREVEALGLTKKVSNGYVMAKAKLARTNGKLVLS